MGEAKVGQDFIKHEFDEAIAIQQVIVNAETELASSHPRASAKRAIKSALADDRRYLNELQTLGKEYRATGEVEDVARGLKELMEETLGTASSDAADSDFYEAHAVLLNLKRKQMDSAGGVLKIARATRNTRMRDAALEFERAQKATSRELAKELAAYAAVIATADTAARGTPAGGARP
jgi:hypothetical protein